MAFELLVPEDEEALFSLMEEKDYRLLAGGTDLYVQMEKDLLSPDRVIDITEVMAEPKIEEKKEKISILATATFQEIAESLLINRYFPVLAQSALAVGATQLRNMATIGGNICNASPSADSLIALYLLNPELVLKSSSRERQIALEDFITGPGETELFRGEYLKSLEISKISEDFSHYFEKVGRRNALDISVCTMGYILKEEDGIIEELRLAYGAVAPTVIRATSVEEYLEGKRLNQENVAEAKKLVKSEISPISDIRGSAEYREKVAARLVEKIGNNTDSSQ
ncbi:MAG: xanthine dehydrogenase family protein subunit M [Candidatus Bipolaricaulota bacterium]|nr:xanthine dehydrogenase family protein subunit M [Candidatus Bipolaricaulota bacterium]